MKTFGSLSGKPKFRIGGTVAFNFRPRNAQNTEQTPLFFDFIILLPHTPPTHTMAKKAKKLKDKNAPKR